jgi:hypothetical protein
MKCKYFTFLKYCRNISEFLAKINKILDTPAKRSLWFYLMPIIEDEHEEVAQRFFKKNHIDVFGEYFGSTHRHSSRFKKNFNRSGSVNNVHDEDESNRHSRQKSFNQISHAGSYSASFWFKVEAKSESKGF